MKKKAIFLTVLIILLAQIIIFNLSNKEIKLTNESIKIEEDEKNIKEIFLGIEKIDKIKALNYTKIDNKWIGNYEFEGNLEETNIFLNSINDFYINSYSIKYENSNTYIEVLLEHK